jgi:hypothetical protein
MNAPKRDWESEFAYLRYLALVTGEGPRQMAAQRGWRKEMSTGPRDWQLTWDLELSVWDFRRRPILKRLACGGAPPLESFPAASPEAP